MEKGLIAMRHSVYVRIILVAALTIAAGCEQSPPTPKADIVLNNAYVYTADEYRNVAESVAIAGNEIVYVGTNDE